eukprot:m.73747 g.73747  ORF g.73747 m.73747 type:complete len:604 (-) comp14381_c0_seq2:63-1874(-)
MAGLDVIWKAAAVAQVVLLFVLLTQRGGPSTDAGVNLAGDRTASADQSLLGVASTGSEGLPNAAPPPPPPAPPSSPRGDSLNPVPPATPTLSFSVACGTAATTPPHTVRVSAWSEDRTIKEAIAAACNTRPGSFGLELRRGSSDRSVVAASIGALEAGATYTLVPLSPSRGSNHARLFDASATMPQPRPQRSLLGQPGATGHRVVICTIATGRYLTMGLSAIQSAIKHFGHDAAPRFFLLTDQPEAAVSISRLETKTVPYRAWPDSGRFKFHDIATSLADELKESDFFYFMDADTRFHEDVPLVDVSGDLVGVAHPFYPRDDIGMCTEATRGWCQYPLERRPKSRAYVPMNFGKHPPKYTSGNMHYCQSAFWGGKSDIVLPSLKLLANNMAADLAEGIESQILQDERYLNWLLWKALANPKINLRILGHSYLYPEPPQDKGFGAWLHNTSRPIIYHIKKKTAKPLAGEVEIVNKRNDKRFTQCLDRFLKSGVGAFGCHHTGGVQGWIVDGKRIRSTDWLQGKQCLTAKNNLVKLEPCKPDGKEQEWVLGFKKGGSGSIRHEASGLCLDSMRGTSSSRDQPVGLQSCEPDSEFQRWELYEPPAV